jgi:hypothetical protein
MTVIPNVPGFHLKFMMPKVGWAGVFKVAIAFDMIAAVLAWFVLRKLKPPVKQPLQAALAGAAVGKEREGVPV